MQKDYEEYFLLIQKADPKKKEINWHIVAIFALFIGISNGVYPHYFQGQAVYLPADNEEANMILQTISYCN